MKKLCTFFTIVGMVFLMGCYNPNRYWHKHPDLYTEAVYSMLGVRSHFDDNIEILETDELGRILFLFQPRDYAFHADSITAIFVCQTSDKDFVYYYPERNFILSESFYSIGSGTLPFSEEEIDQLKEANDWDNEMQPDLFRKKSITRIKDDNIIEEEEALEIVLNNEIIPFSGDVQWICYWDKDSNGQHLFFVQDLLWNRDLQRYTYLKSYIVLLQADKSYDQTDMYIEIANIIIYQTQLSEFLIQHEWR